MKSRTKLSEKFEEKCLQIFPTIRDLLIGIYQRLKAHTAFSLISTAVFVSLVFGPGMDEYRIRIFETFRMRLLQLFENSNRAIANTSEVHIRIFSIIVSIFDF